MTKLELILMCLNFTSGKLFKMQLQKANKSKDKIDFSFVLSAGIDVRVVKHRPVNEIMQGIRNVYKV